MRISFSSVTQLKTKNGTESEISKNRKKRMTASKKINDQQKNDVPLKN